MAGMLLALGAMHTWKRRKDMELILDIIALLADDSFLWGQETQIGRSR